MITLSEREIEVADELVEKSDEINNNRSDLIRQLLLAADRAGVDDPVRFYQSCAELASEDALGFNDD